MVYARGPPKTAMGAAAKVMIVIMVMAVYFKPGSAKNLAMLCGTTGGACPAAQSNQSLGTSPQEELASLAIDGNTNTCSKITADDENKPNPWWRVDFGLQVQVGGLKIYHRGALEGFSVFVGNYRDNPLSNSPCAKNQPAPVPAADVVCNTTLQGRYLFIRKSYISGPSVDRTLALCEVQVFPPPPPNLARMCGKDGKQACQAAQSSNDKINKFSVASKAIDGVISQNNLSTCSQTSLDQQDYSPWWRVDFGRQVQVTGLQVYSSAEGPNALNDFNVYVGNNEVLYSPTGPGPVLLNTPCEIDQNASTSPVSVECFAPVNGQYLFISLRGNEEAPRTLALCEVQVFGTPIDDPPWPWRMPIAAQGAPYGGAIFGPDWDTVCSPGCKSHMLGLAPPVFVEPGLWQQSPKDVKCDIECMTPECGYDFGGCDDELAVTSFNKIDFEMYLASIENKGKKAVGFDEIQDFATARKISGRVDFENNFDAIGDILSTATLEEYSMADVKGDGLDTYEAFALYVMKIQTCNQAAALTDDFRGKCKEVHDLVNSNFGIAAMNMAFRDEVPSMMESTASVVFYGSCNGSNTDGAYRGTISVMDYRNNENCSWLIAASKPGFTIQLYFDSFKTVDSGDYVKIYSCATSSCQDRDLIATGTGEKLAHTSWESDTEYMEVVFASDSGNLHASGFGFEAEWKPINRTATGAYPSPKYGWYGTATLTPSWRANMGVEPARALNSTGKQQDNKRNMAVWPRGAWETWQKWHPKKFDGKYFDPKAKDVLPSGEDLTLGSLAQWLTEIDYLFAGGKDKETWEDKAVRSYVNWTVDFADADGDGKLSRAEGYIIGLSRASTNLFQWLDMNSDGFVSKDEMFTVYERIIDDGNKGKFVCNGLEIIDATNGKIDVRAPMGVKGDACGWLILPSWFYKDVNNHNLLNKTQPISASPNPSSTQAGNNSQNTLLQSLEKAIALKHLLRKDQTATHAQGAGRSKAHRRQLHKLATKEAYQSAARRRLLSSDATPENGTENNGFLVSFYRYKFVKNTTSDEGVLHFNDVDTNDNNCISQSEFDASKPPPGLVFATVASMATSGGCPGEISEADFNALMNVTQSTANGSTGGGGGAVNWRRVQLHHICSGALVSPDAVLTTASCVKQFLEEPVGETKLDFEGVFVKILGDFDSELSISDVLYHPSVNFDMAYDIAVVRLNGTSLAQPVQLYQGGDLGISDCKRMKLSYVSWNLNTDYLPSAAMSKDGSKTSAFNNSGGAGQATRSSMVEHQVRLVDHKDCQEMYLNETGSTMHEEFNVGPQDICVASANQDTGANCVSFEYRDGPTLPSSVPIGTLCQFPLEYDGKNFTKCCDERPPRPTGPCTGDTGLPLTAMAKGSDIPVLVGLSTNDDCDKESSDLSSNLPAVFTRVSSSLQWIRSAVDALSRHPEQFTLLLNITKLGIVDGARIAVYHTNALASSLSLSTKFEGGASLPSCADAPDENCMIDSKCQVPVRISTKDGAILLVLEMPQDTAASALTPSAPKCDQECMEGLGLTASFGLVPCAECTRNCSLSLPWEKLGPNFEDKGKGYTGGLGKSTVKQGSVEYGVWMCVRDWGDEEQLACGARQNELACFWFEENSRQFHFRGLNEKTKLVTAQQYLTGMEMEERSLRGRTLSTSKDQAHV